MIGVAVIFTATVIVLGVNHDDFHFPWLLGFVRIALILGFVLLSLAVAPRSLAELMLSQTDSGQTHSVKEMILALVWIGSFFVLGIAYQQGLQAVDQTVTFAMVPSKGTVVAVDSTLSKGGPVAWAIYEYSAGGQVLQSAVRNARLDLRPGQAIAVEYTQFWPRHSRVKPVSSSQRGSPDPR